MVRQFGTIMAVAEKISTTVPSHKLRDNNYHIGGGMVGNKLYSLVADHWAVMRGDKEAAIMQAEANPGKNDAYTAVHGDRRVTITIRWEN